MTPITVAVAGGSGYLGKHVVEALLSPSLYTGVIGRVIVVTRNPASAACKELEAKGVVIYGGSIDANALQGVDVLLDTIGGRDTKPEYHYPLVEAAVNAGVKVYFSSEFGLDHRNLDFEHPEHQNKTKIDNFARQAAGGRMKVVGVHCGGFMEILFDAAPFLGWDYKTGQYFVVGSPKAKMTATFVPDIAKAVAQLAVLAVSNPTSVPDHVRLCGDAISTEAFARMAYNITGQSYEIKTEDLAAFKASLTKDSPFILYARLMIGGGFADQSQDNANELVNPGQTLWKWKTFEEYAKEKLGKTE